MARIFLISLIFSCIYSIGHGQTIRGLKPDNHAYYYFVYRDSNYMKKSTNKITDVFKKGISDGLYLGFYDKKYLDTAIVAIVKNGLVEGTLFRWDAKDKYLIEISEYKNGLLNGKRTLYLRIDGVIYENIYRYENNVLIERIKTEW